MGYKAVSVIYTHYLPAEEMTVEYLVGEGADSTLSCTCSTKFHIARQPSTSAKLSVTSVPCVAVNTMSVPCCR